MTESARNLAISALTNASATRLDAALVRSDRELNKTNFVVQYQGFDPVKGKHYGVSQGSVLYFDLATTGSVAIGENLEVTRPRYSLYGKGHKLG